MKDLQTYLEISSQFHNHLCPRQILGVRMGLAGVAALDCIPGEPRHYYAQMQAYAVRIQP